MQVHSLIGYEVLTGHAEILGLRGFIAALGAWYALILIIFEALASHMVLTETCLAAQT